MKTIRLIIQICFMNFKKWSTDCRIWLTAVILFLLIVENTNNLGDWAGELGVGQTLWSFPFLYQQYHMKLIFTLPLLLLFCNAPFTDKNSLFVMVRTGRVRWLCGQFLYIVLASAVYYIFLFLCTLILALPNAELTLDWDPLILTLANKGPVNDAHPFINVSSRITTYFTPVSAVWFTFLLSWLCGIMLGMCVMCFNFITGRKAVGTAIASIFIILSCFISNGMTFFDITILYPFSPVTWNTLDNIDIGGLTTDYSFTHCVTVYIVVSVIFIAACLLWNFKKKKIE